MSTLASNVRFEDEPRVVRNIPVGAVLTLAMQGITERGPIGETTLVFDFPDFQRWYGGFTANGNVALCANAFFLNGGTRLRVNRIVHFSDATDASTDTSTKASLTLVTETLAASKGFVLASNAEPYALADGDTLSFSVDGGGSDVATFNATAASRTAGTTGTYDLSSGGETLLVVIDGGSVQTITFQTSMFTAPAAATAAEVAAAISGQITGAQVDVNSNAPRITSDKLGTDSGVNVSGGTANAGILDFTTGNVAGTGDAADSQAITAAELVTLITGDVTGATATDASGYLRVETDTSGSAGSIQVEAASTADDEIGFSNATVNGTDSGAVSTATVQAKTSGAWANLISILISESGTGITGRFKLQVLRSGVTIETWDDLSMDDASDRYAELIINHATKGSVYIMFTDLDAAVSSAANQKPAAGTTGPMTGGDDGLTSLGDADFNGGTGANGDVGLRVFDRHTDIDVLCSPDRATSSHHNAMITYCDITREGMLFAIIDPPASLTAQQMATYINTTAALFGLTENAATYWPRIKVLNPAKSVFGQDDLVTVPPCGTIAGVYARLDASKVGGMFEQPAGLNSKVLPRGIEELETDEVTDIKKRELIFPFNINPISQEEGTPFFIDGARNLDITGSWPSIGEARGVIFVKKRLKPNLGFLRHRNLKPRLYNEGAMTVEAFMGSLQDAEAFAAFSIDFGPALNNAATQNQRQIKARLGIDMFGIGEFVIVFVGPDSDNLDLA